MNARALSIASRAIRPSPRCLVLRTPAQRRFASSERQPSNMSKFYKTFTRPVAKVLLMAFFTYQLAYWVWVKLEQDEIIAQREDYIAKLEDEIAWLTGTKPHHSPTVEEMKRTNSGRELTIQDYQLQLMELEQRNRKVLKAIAQAEMEEKKGQGTTGQQKTSPWWKVW